MPGMQQEILDNLFNISQLRELVIRVTCREIRQCVSQCLTDGSPEPYALLHGLLTALQARQEDADKDEKSLQIFQAVVRTLADEGLTSRNAQDAVSTLVTFVPSLRPVEAKEIFCAVLSVLRSRAPRSPKLFELLPPLAAHLDLLEVDLSDDEEGDEGEEEGDGSPPVKRSRRKAVNKENLPKGLRAGAAVAVMCRGQWCADNTLSVASAFSDATMDAAEREMLLQRLLVSLPDLDVTSLPALVHQIVLIAVKGEPKLALEGLFNFFIECDRRASELDSDSNSQNSCPDIITEGPDPRALMQAEGTILLHFLYAAKQNQNVAKSVLKAIKALLPESSLQPSILGLQLTLMGVPRLEDQFLELASRNIASVLKVLAKFRQSAWIRSLTAAPLLPTETVMRTVDNCCEGQWDCVCPGLLRLALALLDSGQPKGGALAAARGGSGPCALDPISEQLTRLGNRIVRHMFKRLPSSRSEVLEALVRRLISRAQRPTARLYAALISDLVAKFTQSCLEHSRTLREPLDYLPLLPLRVASSYIHGLLPLLRADLPLRNQLMIVLRKALFLRQPEARSVGVEGLLLLLKHFRVVGSLSTQSSQSTSSQDFVCSQVQVHHHLPLVSSNTNDGLCAELLGLLRRCLDQQSAAQRCAIFRGLVEVLERNKQLAMPILSILKAHFDRCFDPDEDVQPPLRVESGEEACVTAVVVAQLSRAVRCCSSCILGPGMLAEAEPESAALSQLCQEASARLRSTSLRMARLSPEDVGAAGSSSQEAGERAGRTAAAVCDLLESLTEFELHRAEDAISEDLTRLFTRWELFRKLVKDGTAPAAKGKGRARSSSSSPSSSPSGQLSLESLLLALRRTFAQTETGEEAAALGRFTLRLLTLAKAEAAEAAAAAADLEHGHEETALLFSDLASECLKHYNGALKLLLETGDSSDLPHGRTVMGQALELAAFLLGTLLDKAEARLEACVRRIALSEEENEGPMTISQLAKRMKRWSEGLLENVSESGVQKDAATLLPLLARLCQYRVSDNLDWLAELADWLAERLRRAPSARSTLDSSSTRVLLQHSMLVARLAKPGHCLLRELACDLHCRLGDVDQNASLNAEVTFESINSRNAAILVPLLTSHIEKALDDCDWLLSQLGVAWPVCARKRGRSREEALSNLDHQERALCIRLGYLCNALDELVQSAVPPGGQADAVLACLTKLYNLLASLSRHYLQLTNQKIAKFSPKFEKLVRLSGSFLSPHCYAFISFVQTLEMQKAREQADAKEKDKKGKKKEEKATNAKKAAIVDIKVSRSVKDSKLLPNLIFAIEQYERFLILLGKRTGTKLMQHVKITTARDFRINQHAVAEALAVDDLSSDEVEEVEEDEVPASGRERSRTEISFGEDSMRIPSSVASSGQASRRS